ncbi:MAG TPA: hypothetical protein VF577_00385 [Allosphingosinicella sp.]
MADAKARGKRRARVVDEDEHGIVLGCLGPQSLLALGKAALLAVFFYALLSALGLWGD